MTHSLHLRREIQKKLFSAMKSIFFNKPGTPFILIPDSSLQTGNAVEEFFKYSCNIRQIVIIYF